MLCVHNGPKPQMQLKTYLDGCDVMRDDIMHGQLT